MSLMAAYVDGELQTSNASTDSLAKKSSAKNSVVDSDTFLTLLVAEMQNQDPLEPTSNTEWVSQYATFTQVEQMGEMADSMDMLRANNLVGKEVIMKVTSVATGETSYVRGVVDYITMEDGKPLLNIGGANYSLDDLDTVASDDYFDCYDFYTEFTGMINALPSVNAIDTSYKTAVEELFNMYDGITDKQLEYMQQYAPEYLSKYKSYIQTMEDLGVTYKSKKEEEVTLDKLLDAFNTKMDDLMKQLSGISASGSAGGTGSTGGTGSAGGAENAGGTAGGTESANGTENAGGTENADGAENADGTENAGGTEGATDGTEGTSGDADTNDDVSGGETAGTETGAENEDSEVSDETLDKITEDI